MAAEAQSVRVQKVMAAAGIASRRRCEALIRAGRVTVNGSLATLGQKVRPGVDEIRVDGEALPVPEPHIYIALNKPRGVLSSLRSQGGLRTVRELVDVPERIYPVGRLDVESEGLLLLSNDGALTDRLTHPRYGHTKEYLVELDRRPEASELEAWRKGVRLPDGFQTSPAEVGVEAGGGGGAWLRVVLSEGHKRQIRETARALGLEARRLVRVRFGPLELGALKPGEWRRLTPAEVEALGSPWMKPSKRRRRADGEGAAETRRGER